MESDWVFAQCGNLMKLNAGCKITVEATDTAPMVLMLRPQSGAAQQVHDSAVTVQPAAPVRDFTDPFGNLCQRVTVEKGISEITAACTVQVADEVDAHPAAPFTLVQNLPDDTLPYLLPSRYCESDDDRMLKLVTKIAGSAAPGYAQLEAVSEWLHRKLRYKYGVSDVTTTALDTAKKRMGVCRDFAHLGIALCRAMRIPARMVSGYLHQLEPMDLHAWFEAFVGGRWYTVDATEDQLLGNRIILAYGRDAADVAQMSEYGPVELTGMSVWVKAA
jgi:transglutaminase-like putative cysteine protease